MYHIFFMHLSVNEHLSRKGALEGGDICMHVFMQIHADSVVSDSLPPRGLYSLPGSSVCGLSEARLLEWVDMPFSMIYI